MSELTGEEIVKRIVSDKGALKELVYHIVSDPEVRMAMISAVLTEVATKQDVRDLRQEMNQLRQEMNQLRVEMDARFREVRQEMNQLRREINDLRREMKSLIRWTITAILVVWGSTVLPVMMRLAGII
jgi:predicted  nucleic acid-binding Zn-ribbon protein